MVPNKLLAYSISGLGIQPGSTSNAVTVLEKIISAFIGIMTTIGVIYFTIQIILAGFSLIASQGDPKRLDVSKSRLTSSILGLAIIVLAYGLGALIASLLHMSSIFSLTTIFAPIK